MVFRMGLISMVMYKLIKDKMNGALSYIMRLLISM